MKKSLLIFFSIFLALSSCVKKNEELDPTGGGFELSSEPLIFLVPEELTVKSGKVTGTSGTHWQFFMYEREGTNCNTIPKSVINRAQFTLNLQKDEPFPIYRTDVSVGFHITDRNIPETGKGKVIVHSYDEENGVVDVSVEASVKTRTGKEYILRGKTTVPVCYL